MVSMIYEKTLEVQSDTDNDFPAVTLMSNEVDNISIGIQNAHETWASPIELAIAIYLLQVEVLWAAAVPAATSLAVFYLTGLISKTFPKRQAAWMQAVRQRVAFTSKYLSTIKTVKMLGLSEKVSATMQELRVQELVIQKRFRHSMIMMNLVGGLLDMTKVKCLFLFVYTNRDHSRYNIKPQSCNYTQCIYGSRIPYRPEPPIRSPNFHESLYHYIGQYSIIEPGLLGSEGCWCY